ncbi:hypothetical protein EON66_02795, partial [archaeon]
MLTILTAPALNATARRASCLRCVTDSGSAACDTFIVSARLGADDRSVHVQLNTAANTRTWRWSADAHDAPSWLRLESPLGACQRVREMSWNEAGDAFSFTCADDAGLGSAPPADLHLRIAECDVQVAAPIAAHSLPKLFTVARNACAPSLSLNTPHVTSLHAASPLLAFEPAPGSSTQGVDAVWHVCDPQQERTLKRAGAHSAQSPQDLASQQPFTVVSRSVAFRHEGGYRVRWCSAATAQEACTRALALAQAARPLSPSSSMHHAWHDECTCMEVSGADLVVTDAAECEEQHMWVSRGPPSAVLPHDPQGAADTASGPAAGRLPPVNSMQYGHIIPPTFSGVAAVGARGLRIPHSDLPRGAQNGGSWALSMWLWMASASNEDISTGACPVASDAGTGGEEACPGDSTCARPCRKPRVLFFKGVGGVDQGRTPSAWVAPDSEHLLLRVSQIAPTQEADVGGRSFGAIPVRRWTHLAFSFENSSAESAQVDAPSFTYRLFIDGELDTQIAFPAGARISANTGPLFIGAYKDFAGVSALVAELRLHNGTVSRDQMRLEFEMTRDTYTPSFAATSISNSRRKGALSPAAQLTLLGVSIAAEVLALAGSALWPVQMAVYTHDQARFMDAIVRADTPTHACARNLMVSGQCTGCYGTAHCAAVQQLVRYFRVADGMHAAAATASLDAGVVTVAATQELTTLHVSYPSDMVDYFEQLSLTSLRALHTCPTEAAALGAGGNNVSNALEVLQEACADGGGSLVACVALGKWFLLPGRDTCKEALALEAPVSTRSLSVKDTSQLLGSAMEWVRTVRTDVMSAMALGDESALPTDHAASSSGAMQVGAGKWRVRQTALGCDLLAGAALHASRAQSEALMEWMLAHLSGSCTYRQVWPADSGIPAAVSVLDDAVALGFVHLAAMYDRPEAWRMLGHHYVRGIGGVANAQGYVAEREGSGLFTSMQQEHLNAAFQRLRVPLRTANAHAPPSQGMSTEQIPIRADLRAWVSAAGVVEQVFSAARAAVPKDAELAAYYMEWAADAAAGEFHKPGAQPLHEIHKLSADSADTGVIEQAERGLSDADIAA